MLLDDKNYLKILARFYEREERNWIVYDHYKPNYKWTLVTRKFYSPHERLDLSIAEPAVIRQVQQAMELGPKERYCWPITENQCYGWYWNAAYAPDPKYQYARQSTPAFKHELRLQKEMTVRPKFTGIPFRF